MTETQKPRNIRLNVNMNEETASRLRDIAETHDISVTLAVQRAVNLAHFLDEHTRKGNIVLVEDKRGKQMQVLMF